VADKVGLVGGEKAEAVSSAHASQVSQASHTSRASHAPQPRQAWLEEILNLLSNVLFPVVVFLIWAAATTVGTIVDQNQPAQHYYDTYPLPVANLILRLHLDNVFHSVPYISLVVLLLVSMSVCTFRRVIPKRFPPDRRVMLDRFGLHASMPAADDPARAAAQVAGVLRARGFRLRERLLEGETWFFGDKQKWARYGVLVAHLGFAVIAFGVFLGWLRGFSGQMVLYQGQTGGIGQAGVVLRLDHFHAVFQPVVTPTGTTYQAQKFESDVTIWGDGTTPRRAAILVNHPYVTQGGVYVYQASYAFAGNLRITRHGAPVKVPALHLNPQDAIFLPGTNRAIEYGLLLGPTDPSQTPPGVPLPKRDEYALWIFHDNIPTTNRPLLVPVGASVDVGDGYRLTALPPTPSTGLTYRYDPGQGWVALGCLILVAGFVMALFFVPVKVYARIVPAAEGCSVECAATTTKGNAIWEDDFGALAAELRRALVPPAAQPPAAAAESQVNVYA
jgi:cytochrome c biogenesis protein